MVLNLAITVSENGLSEKAQVVIETKSIDPDTFSVSLLVDELVCKLARDVSERVKAGEVAAPTLYFSGIKAA